MVDGLYVMSHLVPNLLVANFNFCQLFYHGVQSAGVQFPQRSPAAPSSQPTSQPKNSNLPNGDTAPSTREVSVQKAEPQNVPESRYFF